MATTVAMGASDAGPAFRAPDRATRNDMSARVYIADDHALFRHGLVALFDKEEGFCVVGETGDGAALLEDAGRVAFDVLLLDIAMPGPPVSEVIGRVLEKKPTLGVVVLTMHEEEYYIREVFRAGAKAFVLKKSSGGELFAAVRSVMTGQMYVDPALSDTLVSFYVDKPASRGKSALLTKREQEILTYLALGNTNREIAEQLFISRRTVESHRAHIMDKLGAQTRAELVRYAMASGLLQPRAKDGRS